MIHYALQCAGGHAFDGWFAGSLAFDRQADAGLIDCPHCGGREVTRALMAPAVGRAAAPPPVPAPAAMRAPPAPAAMVALLQKLRAEVERSCDHVGPDFADQARLMHEGRIETRAIYGETTPDEAESLQEDGIVIARIPWVPRADS